MLLVKIKMDKTFTNVLDNKHYEKRLFSEIVF